MSSQRFVATPTKLAALAPRKSTTPKPSTLSTRCTQLTRKASTQSLISSTVRTPSGATLQAADVGWFAGRKITAQNVGPNLNPSTSPQGLNQVARMLADGMITARVRTTVGLEGAGQVLEKLRSGGLSGKAVIRL